MKKLFKHVVAGIASVALLSTVSTFTHAEDFTLEGQTVTWIVGFTEGGGTDRLTRVLQAKLSEYLPGNPNIIVLNKPGGGSITASNDFHANAPADGTMITMASTSTLLPVLLGSKNAKYDPNEWVAVAGFPRGAVMYVNTKEVGIEGNDIVEDYGVMKSSDIRFGTENPLAAELLDIIALHMMDLDAQFVFGLSSNDAEAAFMRGEMNVNTDNVRSYINAFGDNPDVKPLWSYGVIESDDSISRDPDLPNVPIFPEFYTAVNGEAPTGYDYGAYQAVMNVKVMLSKSIMLPKGTPDNIREVYIEAMKKVVADPAVSARLPREIGSMKPNFGNDTQRAIRIGTQMSPEVRGWVKNFLMEEFDTRLD